MEVAATREQIGRRLAESRGRRTLEAYAAKLGITRSRLQQMESGQIPNAWLYLARVQEDGHSIDWLLGGD